MESLFLLVLMYFVYDAPDENEYENKHQHKNEHIRTQSLKQAKKSQGKYAQTSRPTAIRRRWIQ